MRSAFRMHSNAWEGHSGNGPRLTMALEITREPLKEIGRQGARAYPNECCGALLGVAGADGTKVCRALLPLDNRREGEAARTRFLVTADDFRWAEKQARQQGLEVVGWDPSPPDPPGRAPQGGRAHP